MFLIFHGGCLFLTVRNETALGAWLNTTKGFRFQGTNVKNALITAFFCITSQIIRDPMKFSDQIREAVNEQKKSFRGWKHKMI